MLHDVPPSPQLDLPELDPDGQSLVLSLLYYVSDVTLTAEARVLAMWMVLHPGPLHDYERAVRAILGGVGRDKARQDITELERRNIVIRFEQSRDGTGRLAGRTLELVTTP